MREICRAGSGTFRFGMGYIAHRSATPRMEHPGFCPCPGARRSVAGDDGPGVGMRKDSEKLRQIRGDEKMIETQALGNATATWSPLTESRSR
jgi:hypothetical protein